MDPQKVIIVGGMINIACMLFAYWCGRYQERMNWNELITKGILPKPRSAR